MLVHAVQIKRSFCIACISWYLVMALSSGGEWPLQGSIASRDQEVRLGMSFYRVRIVVNKVKITELDWFLTMVMQSVRTVRVASVPPIL